MREVEEGESNIIQEKNLLSKKFEKAINNNVDNNNDNNQGTEARVTRILAEKPGFLSQRGKLIIQVLHKQKIVTENLVSLLTILHLIWNKMDSHKDQPHNHSQRLMFYHISN